MYRNEDIEIIKMNIDNITEEAMLVYKTNYEPTLKENKEVYAEILNFIKKKNRIIYGGYAQNQLILVKNENDGFYKDSHTPDIEFYSFEPLADLIELCDYLKSKHFKYVQGSEGMHEGTYKIFVNFVNYCDISYLAKNIYDNCPIIKFKDDIRYIHPYFMAIDIFRVFVDPMTSYWRLDKSFKRYLKLSRYYPIEYSGNKEVVFKHLAPINILKVIRHKIIHNSKYIVVGAYAFNYYVKKINRDLVKINFYEIITDDLDNDAKKIYSILKNKFGDKIKVNEYNPFSDFFDKRIEFLYENTRVLRVYNNNHRCIVYNTSTKKKTHFGTTQLVFLYLIANYNYYLINKELENSTNYLNMFLKLNEAKDKYLFKHNITVLDSSPFKEFTFKCNGKPVSLERESLLKIMERKKKNLLLKFKYNPTGKPGKVPEYNFSNTSGNKIINEKYLLIK